MSELVLVPRVQIELPRSVFFPNREVWKRWLEVVFMAGSKSQYLAKKQLEEAAGGVAFSAPANVYCGLWTSALDDTSTGSTSGQAAYTSYARTQIGTANNQTDAWNTATGTTTATVTNKNNITFPTSTGSSATITYLMVVDAASTGNMLYWTDVSSVAIASGDTPQVAAGAISIVED